MRKKVADFFRQEPIVAGSLGILIIVLIIVPIIWFIPQWQVPVSGLSLKDRLHQINENRKTVAQIVGGVFLLVGLYIAWVRSKAMRDQAEVDREQQLTDLYVKAIEQLGNKEILEVRLGGIYALERIARESPKDHWPIMEVLTAFVRENAPLKDETEAYVVFVKPTSTPTTEKPPIDIQAVLTVLGRTAIAYAQKEEERSLDLRATHLAGADLQKTNLQRALLWECNLQNANLRWANFWKTEFEKANLQKANFESANLQEADLFMANLQNALLIESDMQGANLRKANLMDADLTEAKLQRARLLSANLKDAFLQGADLTDANLQNADLTNADLDGADLRRAKGIIAKQVSDAIWDATTKWPEGFSPPPPEEENEERNN